MITGMAYSLTNVNYVASQKILVGTENSDLMETYQEIIQGSTVLEKVVENLNLNNRVQDLSKMVEVSIKKHTKMLEIKVFGEDEQLVQAISNEISKVFMTTVDGIYGNAELYKVDQVADYYTSGNILLAGMGSALVGWIVSCLVFIVGWLLDTNIKSCREIEEITGLKSLISIPNIPVIAKKKLNIKSIRAHKSEVFKLLMTNIQFVNNQELQSKSILVTSPNSLEGKTYVATNLAIEFAKAGKKVILIDGDMRRGRIAKIFNLPNDLGFSNYLSQLDSNGNRVNERITRFIHDTEIRNLNVITSGNVPPNPMELLKNERVEELLRDLKVFYDIIVLDTVSLLKAPETERLAEICDLSLILSSYGKTKKEDLRKAYEKISLYERTCIGMGFNKIPDTKFKDEVAILKNNTKRRWSRFFKKVKIFLKKLKNVTKLLKVFGILVDGLKTLVLLMMAGVVTLKKWIDKGIYRLRRKSQEVKEYMRKYKKKKEEIKLIEAAKLQEEQQSNIIRDVFEEKITKLETDEVEYRKKLDHLKANIETKSVELPKVRMVELEPPVVKQEKSKFDLIREQQQKEGLESEKISEEKAEISKFLPEKEERIEEEVEVEETLEPIEEERKEEVARAVEVFMEGAEPEKEEQKEEVIYEEIDLAEQEQLTEEMIRKQVEMDEMVRLAEKEEEEEALRMRHRKIDQKMERRKERKEKIAQFLKRLKQGKEPEDLEERTRKMEEKIEERIKRETRKLENKAMLEKKREEKRAYREIEKQRQREELRIQEELQEDNLYPRPRI